MDGGGKVANEERAEEAREEAARSGSPWDLQKEAKESRTGDAAWSNGGSPKRKGESRWPLWFTNPYPFQVYLSNYLDCCCPDLALVSCPLADLSSAADPERSRGRKQAVAKIRVALSNEKEKKYRPP